MNFRIAFSIFVKNMVGILTGVASTLWMMALGRMDILTMLALRMSI